MLNTIIGLSILSVPVLILLILADAASAIRP